MYVMMRPRNTDAMSRYLPSLHHALSMAHWSWVVATPAVFSLGLGMMVTPTTDHAEHAAYYRMARLVNCN
jgi:hypothetical protein